MLRCRLHMALICCPPSAHPPADMAAHPPASAPQPGKTTLYFPQPLSAVYGNSMPWSYAGGYLT